jgi:Spondin_N
MMKLFVTILLSLLLLSLPSATYAQRTTPRIATPAEVATYRVIFTSTWSAASHPVSNFPSNAHFSPLIGATHNLSATFWLSGTLASPGIEQMAELGATTLLQSEISAAGVNVRETLAGPGMATSPAQVMIPRFTASRSHPLVTLVTMIAPSPDWFVGVHDLALLDDQGAWQEEIVVTLYPYDAGSDDGADYISADVEPTTHQPIALLTGQTPFSTKPIGTFTFTRIRPLYLPLINQQATMRLNN